MSKKEVVIKNFHSFGVHLVFLDIQAVDTEDDVVVYYPTLSVLLDDNVEHEHKVITLNLASFLSDDENIEEMVRDVATRISAVFPDINDIVTVYDIVGEEIGEYSLNDLFGNGEEVLN